jgi:protein arginine kinase activator
VKCDLCDKEATVHELVKKAGQKTEKHFCEECARKQGIVVQPQQQISQLITQLIGSSKPGAAAAQLNPTVQVGACPTCGTTYAQFRHSGLLGCPACYHVFEAQLGPLLQRAHEGGTHHSGKVPQLSAEASMPQAPVAGPSPSPQTPRPQPIAVPVAKPSAPVYPSAPSPQLVEAARVDKIKRLKAQLNEAVAAEQYEKAATIRDELAKLEPPPQGGPTVPARKQSPGGKPTP